MSTNVSALPAHELINLLRAKAKGSPREEAAIELLIAHGTWLRRESIHRYITLSDPAHRPMMASIEWNALAFHQDVMGSSSEVAVLWFAVSLVRDQLKIGLGDLISSMDVFALGLCMQAMAHARGWPERGCQATVTGDFGRTEPRRFATTRGAAYRLLGDAIDWITGDYDPPLSPEQKAEVAAFRTHVNQAKEALNRAANTH